jgi:diguanylate cyclase (GGDEF)-like protein
MEDMIRGAALHGQYTDVPESAAEFEPWFAGVMQNQRSGAEHKIRLPDGRVIELKARRSESGTLVSVRTDITDLSRAEALLRDVLDAIPNAVTAYDADERFILSNRAYVEMFPVSAQIAAPGRRYEEVVRYAVAHGQYPQAGTTPEEQEAWIASQVAHHRNPVGERKLRMADGRFVLARECRSESGNLVSVRTDTTELVRAEGLMRDILESLPSAVMAYDHEERLLLWNQEAVRMLPVVAPFASPGLTLTQMLQLSAEHGQYFNVGDTPEARERWVAQQLVAYRKGEVRTLHLPDGRIVQARESRSDNGNLVCVRTDTTELVRAQALLRDVLDALPSAVNAYDAEGRLILINRAYAELFPIAVRFAVLGAHRRDILRLAAEHGQFPQAGTRPEEQAAWLAEWLAADRAPGTPRTMPLPHGRYVQAQESRSETGVTVCVHTDTTSLKRAEDDLRFQAERDALTLLANRSAFLAALGRALEDAAGGSGQEAGGALLLLDVDYFKQINDTLGHDQGDALLVEIAARLREMLRTGDVAARLGGDEFGVVIPGLTDAASAAPRISAIHAALSAPVELAGRRTPIGISLGVTLFPLDGTDAAKLLKNADLALYEAKRNGRGRWASFRAEQAVALERHVRMADALRVALAQNQFTVALQPKRLLRGGGHAGFEALARWHDGDRWVPPTEFIPVAEDTGLIGALGRVVMAAALSRIRDIRDAGLDPGRVAVNVTGPQLLDSHFKAETLDMLRRHGLRPVDLELELTETILLGRAAERIDAVLRDFSRLGITLALDDFGTGYASLAHLSRLPIDRLKIDRSFVEGIGGGGPGGVIARTVVSLAHSLDMEAIAEGVETPEQVAFLEAAGCDVAQGFLFSRPLLTTAEAIAYLRAQSGPSAPPRRLIARIAHG